MTRLYDYVVLQDVFQNNKKPLSDKRAVKCRLQRKWMKNINNIVDFDFNCKKDKTRYISNRKNKKSGRIGWLQDGCDTETVWS